MTSAEIRASAAAYVRSIRARLDHATTPHEHHAVAADAERFLTQPGAQLLTPPQRRNLTRMATTARTRATRTTPPAPAGSG
jgi:hypothetical protein